MGVSVACHPYQHLICQFCEFSHSNKCLVVSHCFSLQFPNDKRCQASFHMLFSPHLCTFFSEVTVQIFCPCLNQFFLIIEFQGFKKYFQSLSDPYIDGSYILHSYRSFIRYVFCEYFPLSVAYLLILLPASFMCFYILLPFSLLSESNYRVEFFWW